VKVRLQQVKSNGLAVARAGVLAFSVMYAMVELGRVAGGASTGKLLIAVALTLVMLPLHLRHLWFGMRAQRPPRGGITLLAMALVDVVGLIVVGPTWMLMLVALAVSALIVLPARWSAVAVVACMLGPQAQAALAGIHGFFGLYQLDAAGEREFSYIILMMAIGAFALVWLLAAVQELRLSQAALARAAAESERQRVEAQVRASLSDRVTGMLEAGEGARAAVAEEPGVAASVIMLDRLLELSHGALADVRRIVADARTPAGRSATAALVRGARDSDTPVGRSMTIGRARVACWAQFGLWLAFGPLFASGAFGSVPDSGPLALVLAVVAAMALLQFWLLRDLQRGTRPPHATLRWLTMAALWPGLLPVASVPWEVGGYFVAASAALTFSGWLRVLPALAVAAAVVAYDAISVLPHLPGTTTLVSATQIVGDATLTVFVAAGLAGSARLVAVLAELGRVREKLAEHAAHRERRRVSTDVHDILGQSLTAISLKASLAREMMLAGDRAAARSELEGVLALAAGQTAELASVARNEREVELVTELEDAVELLGAAGIEVSISNGIGVLDQRTSSLLGWAVREGTTNILRHANARLCEIVLDRSATHITLELRNDGARVGGNAVAAGRADARSSADGRFALQVELPA
jgi:two-component system sensor histidine kinase DesK